MKSEIHSPPGALPRSAGRRHPLVVLIWYWVPLLIWMAVIFSFSTDAGSTRRTSRFIGPVLRWIFPEISDEAIGAVQLAVRKTAHMVEYGVLAFLAWRAWRKPVPDDRRPWRWADAALSLAIAVLFAISDEWHQSFIPSRQGQVTDVLFDSLGAVLGIATVWSWGRYYKRW